MGIKLSQLSTEVEVEVEAELGNKVQTKLSYDTNFFQGCCDLVLRTGELLRFVRLLH